VNARSCSTHGSAAIKIIAAPDIWLTLRATLGRVRSTTFERRVPLPDTLRSYLFARGQARRPLPLPRRRRLISGFPQ
jgi:hypothetical protein